MVLASKLDRLRRGEQPRVLDLFSGCGGMSLGFNRAGFTILAGLDKDPEAALSHAANFHAGLEPALRALHGRHHDITVDDPDGVLGPLGNAVTAEAVDVVIGGPPCQAYARVGRAKLADVAEHPEAFRVDPRGSLYLRYLRYVDDLKPLALLMENVPDALNYGGHNVLAEVAEILETKGYVCRYTLLNAANFGVPQIRIRAFLLAYHRCLNSTPTFPLSTHKCDLPTGYRGVKSVALKHVDLFAAANYVATAESVPDLPPSVSVAAAIQDLPVINHHLTGGIKRGRRRFDQTLAYRSDIEPSAYGASMRSWLGFESRGAIGDHVIRHLPRDFPIFRRMRPGDEYPAAVRVAEHLVDLEIGRLQRAGLPAGSRTRERLRSTMVPPYPLDTFPNRWWKLIPDRPSRTLLAHLGKDSYTHIHYDSRQARTISVREAARLQSFPDGFVFEGAMNSAFRQIGNAVPPLMAFRLAEVVAAAIRVAVGQPLAA
jgi:DNA (cytosine-5)-methyltransferase 1